MVGAFDGPKSKFTSCLPALNGVLGCGGGIGVIANSFRGVGASTSLSSLSSLDSSMSMSCADCTSGSVGAPPSISMSDSVLSGVRGAGCVGNGIGDLSPWTLLVLLPLTETDGVRTGDAGKFGSYSSLFLSAFTRSTSFLCSLQSRENAAWLSLQFAHRYFDLSNEVCSFVVCVSEAHHPHRVFALHIRAVWLKP